MKNTLTTLRLKGKVKSLTETDFAAETINGETQKSDILGKKIFVFNDKGNKVESTEYQNGGLVFKTSYKYADKENKMEWNRCHADGGLHQKGIFNYDEIGNIIEDIFYNSNGVVGKFTHVYDDNGNKIEENYYPFGDVLSFKNTYKYDYKGNIIERIHNDLESEGSIDDWKETYKYDDKREMIEWNHDDLDGGWDKHIYKYIYDETGNWIKQTAFDEFENGIPQIITEREIEYYDEPGQPNPCIAPINATVPTTKPK